MKRQSFLFSLFAFLLFLAQQQALLHPYEHTADWLQKSGGGKKAVPYSDACEKCASLADLQSGIVPVALALQLPFGTFERSSKPIQFTFPQPIFFYHARAPPLAV